MNKYYASEIDKYAIKITQSNYPDTIQLGDVREIDFTQFIGEIDLVIGGSPCQDLSIAKADRKGLDGSRSGLFFKFVEAIETIKPKYFLLENVKMAEKWKNVITKTLGVEPIMINSNLLSAQNRPRLYWTNIPGVSEPEDKGLFIKDVLDDEYTEKEVLSQKIIDRYQPIENSSYAIGTTKPEFRTIGQRDYVFGDDNKMGCLTATDYKQPKQVLHNGVLRKISPIEAERFQTLTDNYTQYGKFGDEIKPISNTKRFEVIGNGWTVDIISWILSFLK